MALDTLKIHFLIHHGKSPTHLGRYTKDNPFVSDLFGATTAVTIHVKPTAAFSNLAATLRSHPSVERPPATIHFITFKLGRPVVLLDSRHIHTYIFESLPGGTTTVRGQIEDLIREYDPSTLGSPSSHAHFYTDLPTNILENKFVLAMLEYTRIHYSSRGMIAEGHTRWLSAEPVLACRRSTMGKDLRGISRAARIKAASRSQNAGLHLAHRVSLRPYPRSPFLILSNTSNLPPQPNPPPLAAPFPTFHYWK